MLLSQSGPQMAQAPRRQGLTLIELIVVLMILIALAGLLAPMLPSMLTRAHTSTCSTNIASCGQGILQYQTLYNQYPNNWDALGDGTTMINYFADGAACPAQYVDPAPVVASSATSGANGQVTPLTLTAAEAAVLNGVGITIVEPMATTPGGAVASGSFDPTFSYYTNAVPTTTPNIATGTVLAGLDPAGQGAASATYAQCVAMNLDLTGRYVLLGIGPRVSMVGKTIQTPPVHFGDQPVLSPEYGYERLVAIFKVSTGNGTTAGVSTSFTQAQLVGVAPVHDSGLGSIQDELQNWYQLTTGGS